MPQELAGRASGPFRLPPCSLRLGLVPPYKHLGLAVFLSLSVSPYEATPIIFTISSSLQLSCDPCLAYLLPTEHPGHPSFEFRAPSPAYHESTRSYELHRTSSPPDEGLSAFAEPELTTDYQIPRTRLATGVQRITLSRSMA